MLIDELFEFSIKIKNRAKTTSKFKYAQSPLYKMAEHSPGMLYRSGSKKYFLGVYTLGGEPQLINAQDFNLFWNYGKDYEPTTPKILVFKSNFPALATPFFMGLPEVGRVRLETRRRALEEEVLGYLTEDSDKPRDILDAVLDGFEITVVLPLGFERFFLLAKPDY